MANDANFNFYLNRSGPRGQKGEKGDQGFSPSITTNTNTADEYTLLIQNEYDSFVTDNIRPTYDDRGGTYVRVDRANNVQYFGSADIATTDNYGEVKLAQASDLASTVDVGNSNVITVELLKTWFDGQLADNLVTTTNNVTIMGQKTFATSVNFTDNILVRGGDLKIYATSDTSDPVLTAGEQGVAVEKPMSLNAPLTAAHLANFNNGIEVKQGFYSRTSALLQGETQVQGNLIIQSNKTHLTNGSPQLYLENFSGTNEIMIGSALYNPSYPTAAENYLSIGHSQLQLNLTGKAIKANGKDVATADTVDAMQSDLAIAKQDIIEAQGDIDNLQMHKQDKLTAGTGITIDADNVISATGGVVDLPIASSTTLGGIKVGENLTISEDGTLSATGGGGGGTGDVSAAGDNTFTGENTFNGVVNLNGVSTAENLTVKRNLTSNGEINAVSIKTTGLRSDDIKTTVDKKYLTEVDVDNQTIQVVDGKLHANLDELGNEVNTLSGKVAGLSGDVTTLSSKVTAVENTKQNKFSAVAPLYLQEIGSLPLTGVGDVTTLPTTALQPCGDSTVNLNNARGVFRLRLGSGNRKIWLANNSIGLHVYGNFSGHSAQFYLKIRTSTGMSDAISKVVDNNPRIYSEDIIVTISSVSRTNRLQVAYASDPDTLVIDESIRYNQNTVSLSDYPCPYIEAGNVTIYKEGLIFATGTNTALQLSLNETIPTKTSELTNDSGFVTADSSPILDVPVNNCVLAMPTAPTFDGTNVKVYAGTKVAIANGLNTDGTCKSNIVTLTADATINQSAFNGDVTLMLKSNGTIDQTAYSYFEVDDISTITTLTPYCWYYDRKTNNHYLASSTGAKQGPYQRIKIGSYNQATAATTKYFKTYKPITLERLDVTGSCMLDYTAGVTFTRNADHVAPCDGVVLIFTNLYGVASGSCYMTINDVRLNTDMGGNSAGTYFLYFPVAKGDTYNWTDASVSTTNNYTFYPLKGAK